MAEIVLRVLYPHRVELPITVKATDTAQSVVLSGPPLGETVVPVHKGRCLSPYLSLQAQGVSDGDVVVLCPIPQPPRRGRQRPAPSSAAIFEEVVRLADVAFHPFEASQYGAALYRQMLADATRRRVPPKESAPTVIPGEVGEVCAVPLPPCWADERAPRSQAFRSRTVKVKATAKQEVE
jgi:hypothetical protein